MALCIYAHPEPAFLTHIALLNSAVNIFFWLSNKALLMKRALSTVGWGISMQKKSSRILLQSLVGFLFENRVYTSIRYR